MLASRLLAYSHSKGNRFVWILGVWSQESRSRSIVLSRNENVQFDVRSELPPCANSRIVQLLTFLSCTVGTMFLIDS